jgi:predicted DNA-binding protein
MLSVRLPEELEQNLTILSEQMHINKSKLVITALKEYIEDKQDYLAACDIFGRNNKRYTHEELISELGL